MEGNGLKADHVVATGDAGRDGACPAVVLVDHLLGGPFAAGSSSG